MIDHTPRALVVACNFPPDASVGTMRTLRLVRHLSGSGWQVGVVTISPESFRAGTVVDQALLDKVPAAARIVRTRPLRPFERLAALVKRLKPRSSTPRSERSNSPSTIRPVSSSPQRGIRRVASAVLALPDREVSWMPPAVWSGYQSFKDFDADVVYSSGPPFSAHLVGLILSRLLGAPWVADFRDPWARAPWREDRFEFERRTWGMFERLVVRNAHAVVFVTDTNRKDFARQYPREASRFFLVPNGCDPGDFEGLSARTVNHDSRLVLLHAGSLYGARNPASLLRAIASAIAKGRIDKRVFRLRFIGRLGLTGVDLPSVARDLGIADVVEFASHLPRRDCLQEMLDASALLIVQPVTTVSIPAKLYEYMAAQRPILALAEPGGETAELVTRSGAGHAVLADDEAAIEDALVSVVRLAREGFAPVDPTTYDGNVRAAELRRILTNTIAQRRPPEPTAHVSPTAGTSS